MLHNEVPDVFDISSMVVALGFTCNLSVLMQANQSGANNHMPIASTYEAFRTICYIFLFSLYIVILSAHNDIGYYLPWYQCT